MGKKKGSKLQSYTMIDYIINYIQIGLLVFAIYLESIWIMLVVMVLILIGTTIVKGVIQSLLIKSKYRSIALKQVKIKRSLDIVLLLSFGLFCYIVAGVGFSMLVSN